MKCKHCGNERFFLHETFTVSKFQDNEVEPDGRVPRKLNYADYKTTYRCDKCGKDYVPSEKVKDEESPLEAENVVEPVNEDEAVPEKPTLEGLTPDAADESESGAE